MKMTKQFFSLVASSDQGYFQQEIITRTFGYIFFQYYFFKFTKILRRGPFWQFLSWVTLLSLGVLVRILAFRERHWLSHPAKFEKLVLCQNLFNGLDRIEKHLPDLSLINLWFQ